MKKFVSAIMVLIMVVALYVPVKAEDQQVTETGENVSFSEYATVGKNAFFDTGYTANNNTRVVMDIDLNNTNGSFFGTIGDLAIDFEDEGMRFWKFKNMEFYINKIGDKMVAGNGVDSAKEFTIDFSAGRHVIEYGPNGVLIDGGNVCEYIRRGIWNVPSLYLFATHKERFIEHDQLFSSNKKTDYTTNAEGTVTFYSCQIYEGDTLIHDYIPAVLKSDGTPVVFDKVAGVSYGYSGTISNVTSVNVSEDESYLASAFGDGNVMVIIILMIIIIGCGAAFVLYETKSRS